MHCLHNFDYYIIGGYFVLFHVARVWKIDNTRLDDKSENGCFWYVCLYIKHLSYFTFALWDSCKFFFSSNESIFILCIFFIFYFSKNRALHYQFYNCQLKIEVKRCSLFWQLVNFVISFKYCPARCAWIWLNIWLVVNIDNSIRASFTWGCESIYMRSI